MCCGTFEITAQAAKLHENQNGRVLKQFFVFFKEMFYCLNNYPFNTCVGIVNVRETCVVVIIIRRENNNSGGRFSP